MKKIYKSLFITMIAAAGFTACSDYEAPDITTESAITIVSRNTDFPAAASTGVIKFKADGPVTVSSANDWITASVEGDEINISVVQNNSIDGRAGSIIVKNGNAEDEISIIQSGIIFKFDEVGEIATDSDPSTHAYPIDANAPIEVSSDADWVKVAVADGKLSISIDPNPTLDPRSATVTVKCGDTTYEIPVAQKGLVFPLFKIPTLRVNDSQSTTTYEFKADITVNFTSDADWAKGEFANNTVTITTEPNTTGHIRYANLTYEVAGETGSLAITQAEFDKDIAGDLYIAFNDYFENLELAILPATLSRSENSYTLAITDITVRNTPVYTLPVDYNDETLSITISSYPAAIGTWGSYYCFLMPVTLNEAGDDIDVYFTRNQKMDAQFVYTVSSTGSEGMVAMFKNNSANALSLIGYSVGCNTSNTTLSNDTFQGNLEIMVNPYLIRLYTSASTTSSADVKTAVQKVKQKSANIPFRKNSNSSEMLRRVAL